MAAIAYVTDEKMLEYHRFNGSHSIVFWRLSSKKFTDFKPGDLLFFLAKDANSRSREKGLLGYGCFMSDTSMSLNSMWNKYKTATGYSSKRDFEEAVVKSCKTEEIPKKIGCLILDKVVFFQSPIYLSTLGYNISNKLESFMYLDKHNGAQTLRILNEAKTIGLDSWSSMENETINDELFEQQLIKYKVATVLEQYELKPLINTKKTDKALRLINEKNAAWINNTHDFAIGYADGTTVYYLFDSPAKKEKDNFFWMLGMLSYLKKDLKQAIQEDVNIKVVSFAELSELEKACLQEKAIKLIEL